MGDASGPAGTPAGVNLPEDALARAFPFHIACEDRLAIVQVGHSMTRMAPDVQPGERLDALLAAVRPAGDLTTASS